jgi:hypothetical protein
MDTPPNFLRAPSGGFEPKGDLIADGRSDNLIRGLLRDKAEKTDSFRRSDSRGVSSRNANVPGIFTPTVPLEQSCGNPQECGLAASSRAGEEYDLTLWKRQGRRLYGCEFAPWIAIAYPL